MLPYSPLSPEERPPVEIKKEENVRRGHGLMLLGTALALVALGGAAFAYYYFFLQKPVSNLKLDLLAPESVLLGDPFELDLNYANNSDQVIRNSAVTISLPEGIELIGAPNQRFWEDALGDLEPGIYGKRTLRLIATEDPDSIKRFDANFRYSVTNDSGSQFRISDFYDLAVRGSAIYANLEAPQKVMSGQDFALTLNYRNESQKEIGGVKFTLGYPAKMEVRESSSTPEVKMSSANTWDLGILGPGATGTILMMNGFTGEAGYFNLDAKITAERDGSVYTLWTSKPSISVSQAPLSLTLLVNGEKNFVADPGDDLVYRLVYKNNSNVVLQDAKLEAQIAGSMYDLSRLRTEGVFNSMLNKLFWDSSTIGALANIGPGVEGYVEFSIPIKRAFTIKRISDKNFSVKVQAMIESPTVPSGVDAAKTISAASVETRIAGDIAFNEVAYYYEPAASGIKNMGPYPLRVNKPTQFTIHWVLKNSATDMKNVKITAKLPSGVSFTGAVKSTEEAKPNFDSRTGEVSWEVPFIAATKGLVGAPAEAIFQVQVTPSINQIGQSIPLIGEAGLVATDAWTGRTVTKTFYPKDTNLPDDSRAGGDGRVRN